MVVDVVCTPFESVYVENSVRIIVLCGRSDVVVGVDAVGTGVGSFGQGEKRVWMGIVCGTRTGMVVRRVMGFVTTTSDKLAEAMIVDERQVGFAPAVVFRTSQRVEMIVAVLVKVDTELKIVVDTEGVEYVSVVMRVWVGTGVQAIPNLGAGTGRWLSDKRVDEDEGGIKDPLK